MKFGDQGADLAGVQQWTVIGDTAAHPVDLVTDETDICRLTRMVPGVWRAEALASCQCHVSAMYAGQAYQPTYVVTTYVDFSRLEINVAGATKLSDTEFDGGKLDTATPLHFTVSWVDHGNTETVDQPGLPINWEIPATGLNVQTSGLLKQEAAVVALSAARGQLALHANIVGKEFTIYFTPLP